MLVGCLYDFEEALEYQASDLSSRRELWDIF